MKQFAVLRRCCGVLPLLALAACGSAPVHYYQLQASIPLHQQALAGTVLLVEPANLPADVDRPQLLLEDEQGRPQLQEQHYWTASLSRLLTQAVAGNLSNQLALSTIYAAPQRSLSRHDLSLYLDIRQFSLQRGTEVRLSAAWRLDRAGKNSPLLQGYFNQALPVNSSTNAALVQAQQQLVRVMSEQIGAALQTQPALLNAPLHDG